jgi:biopolymer transport protein ExbB
VSVTGEVFSIAPVLAQGGTDLSVFDLAVKGGIMMIPIAVCSLIVVSVIAERASVLRASRIVPEGFEKRLKKAMGSGGPDGVSNAREQCKKSRSPAGRVIAAGIDKLGHRHEIVEKHMAAAGEHEVYSMRKRLRTLTVIAAVSPLMGLTGTIFGMIRAFQTVASSGESLGKAELLAGGIYEAMITTAAGLLVAMPALIFYHWLASKIERLTRELDRIAVGFVERYVLEPAGASADDAAEVIVNREAAGAAVDDHALMTVDAAGAE